MHVSIYVKGYSVLEKAFNLIKSMNLFATNSEFSTRFLGMSERYYDYVKCSGEKPSLKALVHLSLQIDAIIQALSYGVSPKRAELLTKVNEELKADLHTRCLYGAPCKRPRKKASATLRDADGRSPQ